MRCGETGTEEGAGRPAGSGQCGVTSSATKHTAARKAGVGVFTAVQYYRYLMLAPDVICCCIGVGCGTHMPLLRSN